MDCEQESVHGQSWQTVSLEHNLGNTPQMKIIALVILFVLHFTVWPSITEAQAADASHGNFVMGLDQRLGGGDLTALQRQSALTIATTLRTILLRDSAVSSPEGYSVRVHRAFGSRNGVSSFDSGQSFFAGAYGTFFSAEAKPSPTHFGNPDFGIYINTVLQCPMMEFSPPNGGDDHWRVDGHLPVLQGGRRTGDFRGYEIYDGQCVIMSRSHEKPFLPLTREQFLRMQIQTLQIRMERLRSQYAGQTLDPTVRDALESVSRQAIDAIAQLNQTLASMSAESRQAQAAVRTGYADAELSSVEDKDAIPLSVPNPAFFDKSLPSTTVQAIAVFIPFLQLGERAAGLPPGLSDEWRPAAEQVRDRLDWSALAALLN